MRTPGRVAAIALSAAVLVAAQNPSEFEVASIKRNDSGEGGYSFDVSRGQLRAISAPLQPLLCQAFEVMGSQIVGAPSWVATERYDIVAKAPEGVAEMRPLLRALLAERFKLASHRETRDMPVFALGPPFSTRPALRASCTSGSSSSRRGAARSRRAQAPTIGPTSSRRSKSRLA